MLCCVNDLLESVATATGSRLAPGMAVRTVVFTCLLRPFLGPSREATNPRFDFHLFIVLNLFRKNERGDVVFVLVSVLSMTLLPKPAADLTIDPPKPVTDGTTMLEFPEGFLQLPVGVNFLSIKPRACLS